jgi:3-oxoacyl-[acyl-carrier protein] reductase
MNLKGKTALITGASRGIGAAVAEAFVRDGARVYLSARSAGVADLAARLRDGGFEAEALAGDISDDAFVRSLVQSCRAKFGGLDVLVNNAGVLVGGKLGMIRMDDVRRMFEVNVFSAINLTQYAARLFPAAGGSVVNVASIAGTDGMEGLGAYSASKAALVGFTRAAAKELASRRIRVNAIAPGLIDTDMARQGTPEWLEDRQKSVRMGRMGQPSDVAGCAVFLASDAASFITGQVFGVDGGMSV